jgi:hypothetical protein
MKTNEVYADIVEWNTGRHHVISDEAAGEIIGDFGIDGTVADVPGLIMEIITKGQKLGDPIELAALLGWVNWNYRPSSEPPVIK